MRSLLQVVLIVLLMVMPRYCPGIALDDYTVGEQPPVAAAAPYDTFDWSFIYQYKNASSVAVDRCWILTAAHVANDGGSGNLILDGETYVEQERIFHPTADLALVRYDKPFPGYYLLHSGGIYHLEGKANRPVMVYDPLIMVGFGYDGSVSASSFTQGSSRRKRWGTNRGVNATTVYGDEDGDGTADFISSGFTVDFDLSDTPYEAGGNVFDSGGPYFIETAGGWRLCGINVGRQGAGPFTGNSAVMVSDYAAWIRDQIPDYDTDMDGLPDWWETLYAGDPLAMERDGRSDGDPFTNYEEWLADTVPTNSDSCLTLSLQTDTLRLMFDCSTNRRYRVESRGSLSDSNESWQVEADWFVPEETAIVLPVAPAVSNRFYCLHVGL